VRMVPTRQPLRGPTAAARRAMVFLVTGGLLGFALILGSTAALADDPTPPSPTPPAPAPPEQQPPPAPAPAAGGDATVAEPPAAPAVPQPPRTPEQQAGDALVAEALRSVSAGEFGPAAAKFQEALTHDPDNATAHTYLCFLSFRKGDYPSARASCDRAIAITPKIPLALLLRARMDEAAGGLGKASDGYLAAAEAGLSSKRIAAEGGREVAGHSRYLRALIEARMGDHNAALTDLDRAIKIFPQNAYASYEGGLSLLAQGRNEEASNAFRSALASKDKWFSSEAWLTPIRRYLFFEENTHFWLGVSLLKLNKAEKAIAELEPLLSSVESRLGTEIRSAPAAAADPGRALEGEPDTSYYRTHFELAKAYAAAGDKSKAVETLRSFLRVEQTDKPSIDEARALIKTIKG